MQLPVQPRNSKLVAGMAVRVISASMSKYSAQVSEHDRLADTELTVPLPIISMSNILSAISLKRAVISLSLSSVWMQVPLELHRPDQPLN